MRPSWDEYFLRIAYLVASRSTCLRRQVGAVIVNDHRILTTGYNGAPRGLAHCSETGCLREEQNIPSGERHELCRASHAEANAIIQASYYGVAIAGSKIYATLSPCVLCAKLVINAGIKEIIIANEFYPDELSGNMLKEAKIKIKTIEIDKEKSD
jgi:dCMP deaminase